MTWTAPLAVVATLFALTTLAALQSLRRTRARLRILESTSTLGNRPGISDADPAAMREAQEAIRLSEARFKSLFESCPMGIHTYALSAEDTLVFTGANPAASRILGVDNSPFVGRTLPELFPPLAHTDVPRAYRQAALEGTPYACEQLDYDHGQVRGAFEVFAFQTAPRHIAVLFQDITQRKRAEHGLRESEERFRQLAETIREVFWLVDWPDMQVVYVSPAVESLWGHPPRHFRANPSAWSNSLHPEDHAATVGSLQSQITAGQWMAEYRVVQPNGRVRWIRDRRFAIRNPAWQIYRIAGVAEDITERREVAAREECFRRLAGHLTETHTLHDLGRLIAEECTFLFRHDAFLLNLLNTSTGRLEAIYAEDTPPGARRPIEVLSPGRITGPELLRRMKLGQPVCIQAPDTTLLEELTTGGHSDRRSQSLLFCPVLRDGACIGAISIQSYESGRYTSADSHLLQVFANQCAAAIARLQSEQNLLELNRQLESKVQERTNELQRIVNLMAGREIRMAQLKEEIRTLRQAAGTRPSPEPGVPPSPPTPAPGLQSVS